MMYSNKLQKAIKFAIKVHQGQTRKGKDESYIVHPLAVGLILARVTNDEDIIIAGILHDTIEDCKPYGSITKELIVKEFGENVAEMVNDATEQDKSLPWIERKRLALEHIPQMSEGSLLVKSADVLHNMVDQIADYKVDGDAMFEKFNAGKDKQLKRYENLVEKINKSYPNNPLGEDLELNLKELQKLW
ncbi:MAG: HD domain-containing protein [Candidatus Levybacteria bacterium]|nr:HD domain-containing protein [Candidatus Levybacteria bacterium]